MRIVAAIGGFALLQRLLPRAVAMSAASYEAPCLVLSWLQLPKGLLFALFIGASVALTAKLKWNELVPVASVVPLRCLISATALVLVWPLSCSPHNFYFNQFYLADRALLVGFFLAFLARPASVFPLVTLAALFQAQFSLPIGGMSWAIMGYPLKGLLAFAVFLLIRRFVTVDGRDFFATLLVVSAAHYWVPGISKVWVGWLLHDQVAFLIPSTYANNWLGWVKPETIAGLTAIVESLNVPTKLLVLAVEAGSIFVFAGPVAVRILTGCWTLFHLGIALLTGIFLWPWVVGDLMLLALALRKPELFRFSRKVRLVCLAALLISPRWAAVEPLTWFDARASYTYRCVGIGESGTRYPIPPHRFAPYDYQLTLGHVAFLSRDPILPIGWGATSLAVAQKLELADSAEKILKVERELGYSRYDPKLQADCTLLFQRFMAHSKAAPLWLAPPYLFTYAPDDAYLGQEPLEAIEVHEALTGYDGERYLEIRDRLVLTVHRL